jgi:hypothetical protein
MRRYSMVGWMAAAFILSLLAPSSRAGEVNNIAVEKVRVQQYGAGIALVTFVVAPTASPTCASSSGSGDHRRSLLLDLGTTWGRSALALALTAQSQGKNMYAKGTNSCTIVADIETWVVGWIIN